MTKVSICIPTYNHADFVIKAVRSALAQTLQDIEVVVSENHSTDNTRQLLSEINDSRLRIVSPPTHIPRVENWNYAVSQARSPYVNVLCSDDLVEPELAKEQAAILDRNPNVAFVHAGVWTIDGEGNKIKEIRPPHGSRVDNRKIAMWHFLHGNKCAFQSAVFRKDMFDKIGGFPLHYQVAMDWSLWIRLLTVGDVAYNDKMLASFRYWGQNITTKAIRIQMEDNFLCVKEAAGYLKIPDQKLRKILDAYAVNLIRIFTTTQQEHWPELKQALLKSYESPRVHLEIRLSSLPGYGLYVSFVNLLSRIYDSTIRRAYWSLRG